jgi:hypothetical protein
MIYMPTNIKNLNLDPADFVIFISLSYPVHSRKDLKNQLDLCLGVLPAT